MSGPTTILRNVRGREEMFVKHLTAKPGHFSFGEFGESRYDAE
jgi:hypothetical protein